MKKDFKINTEIYSENIISQAIWDFSEVWKINLENNYIEIIWENEMEIDEIFNELMNYCISLISE